MSSTQTALSTTEFARGKRDEVGREEGRRKKRERLNRISSTLKGYRIFRGGYTLVSVCVCG